MMRSHDDDYQNSSNNSQPENRNGLEAFGLLTSFLDKDEWFPRRIEGKYAYSMSYSGKNGDLRCYAIIRVDLEEFLFYAVAPVKAPEEVRVDSENIVQNAVIRYGGYYKNYG